MDAIEQLLPISSLSVDQVNPLDLSMKHIDDRYTEALPEIHEVVPQPVHDHPGVQHLIKHGPTPVQRLSDFVSFFQGWEWFLRGAYATEGRSS
ncbi:hypothetical protein [Verrucomicrobium spinosum]|uniref:hypothetical protein n=1 Tax=Verrucomicrobium spinosum TaxID=2736 RepID=UPI0012F6F565|nr:hypothetical protein [Verrucomicrobium spinosum]